MRMRASLPSNRTSPIAITSDADYPLYASSGSGTELDPWVLEDLLIECNGSGGGITIQNCEDYAIVRDCYVNESDVASAGCATVGSQNVVFDNVTVDVSVGAGIAIIASDHITIQNSRVSSSGVYGVYTDGSYDITVDNCIIDQMGYDGVPIYQGIYMTANYSSRVTTRDTVLIGNATQYLFYATQTRGNLFDNVTAYNGTRLYFYQCAGGAISFVDCNFTTSDTTLYFHTNCNQITIDNCIMDGTTSSIFGYYSAVSQNIVVTDSAFYSTLNFYGGSNISVSDCVFNGSHVYLSSCGNNVTIEDSTFSNANYGIYGGATETYIHANTFVNITNGAVELGGNAYITNNTVSTCGGGFILASGGGSVESNRILHMLTDDAIYLESMNGVTVRYNYIYAPDNASLGGSGISTGCALYLTSNTIIEWNTFDSVNGTGDGYGVCLTDVTCTNVTITYNTFMNCFFGICTSAVTNPIHHNWFKNNHADFEEMNGVNSSPYYRNYYYEYFDVNPYSITANCSTTILDTPYRCSYYRSHFTDPVQTRYDSEPLYWEDWYPRTDDVYVSFYSVFDYLGIDFDLVKLYVDGALRVRRDNLPGHVLYHVEVRDFANRTLWDRMYNMNYTVDLDIGLSIVTIQLQNNFNVSVLFHYSINGIEVVVPCTAGESRDIRVSTGVLSYWVTNTDGDIMEYKNASEIIETITVAGQDTISFGWTEVAIPPGPITVYQTQLLDYVLMLMLFGLIIGVVVFLAFKLQGVNLGTFKGGRPSFNSRSSSKDKKKGRKASNAIVKIFQGW